MKGNKISPSGMKNVSISSGVKEDDPARNGDEPYQYSLGGPYVKWYE